MNRQALINFKNAMAAEVQHSATVIIETQVITPQLEKAVQVFGIAHEVACRELAIGRPAARAHRLEEAIQIARIHLERWTDDPMWKGSPPDEALAILKNAIAWEEGNV